MGGLPKEPRAYVEAFRSVLEDAGVKVDLEFRSRRHPMLRCTAPSGVSRCRPVSTTGRVNDDAQRKYYGRKDALEMLRLLGLAA